MSDQTTTVTPGNLVSLVGDATAPVGNGPRILLHCCNDRGAWGAGFVKAISVKWPQPEHAYRTWAHNKHTFGLGKIQMVKIPTETDFWVCNLVGQQGLGRDRNGVPAIRYEALRMGFKELAKEALEKGATIHAPRLGCDLAGGSWRIVQILIEEELLSKGINFVVYDFLGGSYNP